MRTTRANRRRRAGSASRSTTTAFGPNQPSSAASSPETARLRRAISTCDEPSATIAAQLLLELHEPEDFAEATAIAFPVGQPSEASRSLLRQAWSVYHHDRSRSWN